MKIMCIVSKMPHRARGRRNSARARPRAVSGMKIVLISPKGPLYRVRGGIFKRSLRYQPLTLTTLAALVPPDLNEEILLYDEGVSSLPEDIAVDADLVGLTVITGTAFRAYELADRFRAQGKTVVLGGRHAPDRRSAPRAQSAAHDAEQFSDFAIVSEEE